MNNSDETLKKPLETDAVLQAIADLSKNVAGISNDLKNLSVRFDMLENRFDNLENRFDGLEKFVAVQFETVREGIEYNSARDDRLEAKFYEVRSDVFNMRADIKELTQVVRKRALV